MKKPLLLAVSLFITGMVFGQSNYNWYKPETKIIKEQPSNSLAGVCGASEGCYWTSEERSAAVASFAACMSVKASILIDETDFDYDDYDYHQMGTAHCWGYAHHSSVMLPAIVELKY